MAFLISTGCHIYSCIHYYHGHSKYERITLGVNLINFINNGPQEHIHERFFFRKPYSIQQHVAPFESIYTMYNVNDTLNYSSWLMHVK